MPFITLDIHLPQVTEFRFIQLLHYPLSRISFIDCRKGHKLVCVSLSQMHGCVPEGSGITQFMYFHNRFSSWVLDSQKNHDMSGSLVSWSTFECDNISPTSYDPFLVKNNTWMLLVKVASLKTSAELIALARVGIGYQVRKGATGIRMTYIHFCDNITFKWFPLTNIRYMQISSWYASKSMTPGLYTWYCNWSELYDTILSL